MLKTDHLNSSSHNVKTITQGKDSKTCDPWIAREFTTHMEEETNCPHCLADCELTTYSTTITSSEFRLKREKSKAKKWLYYSRLCDSRNLNLSPFCNLTSSSLVKWQPAVNEIYAGNNNATYINELNGPLRPKYPPNKVDEELLSSLTQVKYSCKRYTYIFTDHQIFLCKGKPDVQRLRKGHCCCQSLLWRLDSIQ